MLCQEIDAYRVKLENQSVNEMTVLSLRLELKAVKDELNTELSNYRNDMKSLQQELEVSKSLRDEDKLTFSAALEEKEEALL
jgi:hypothetical protein